MLPETGVFMNVPDGSVVSDRTRWGIGCFQWPSQKQKVLVHLSKTPRKSFFIKAPSCPSVIPLCIISPLQLSVAIRLSFFMQISLTAQQSVMQAPASSFYALFSVARLPSHYATPPHPHFLWHLQRLLHLNYLSYKVRIYTTQGYPCGY